jgi:hypothetical protein
MALGFRAGFLKASGRIPPFQCDRKGNDPALTPELIVDGWGMCKIPA